MRAVLLRLGGAVSPDLRSLVAETAALALRRVELRHAVAKALTPARRDAYERELAATVIAHEVWRERLRSALDR